MPGSRPPYDQATELEKGTVIATSLNGKTGAVAGRRIEVNGPMVIGREDADITIEDPEISRRHAEVRPAGDRIEIEDLGSTNGTFVNGERITRPYTLSEGDFVRVGQSELELEDDRPAGGTVVAASPSGGTSLSQTPPPAGQRDDIRPSAATGTSSGAPPSVESWSPAPTGAGPGGPSQPPAAAYSPPPTGGGYAAGQGYGGQQGQQGYGSGYPTGSA
ncbi:MAG: FHA domain-containing protein, partial [Actinomycetota bacterium]|nr:FHA domain-containing protein [Actinomycetota bacterium]